MDFNTLPVELFEEILSYLPYQELLAVSLVCREWKHTTDQLIVRTGKLRVGLAAEGDLRTAETISRNYRTVQVHNSSQEEKSVDGTAEEKDDERLMMMLQPVLPECARELTPRNLQLVEFTGDHVYQFTVANRDWIESITTLSVRCLYGCRYSTKRQRTCTDEKELILEFPNLRHLTWNVCYRCESKPLLLDAPNLETVRLCSESEHLKILNCDKLKRANYSTFNEKPFREIFGGRWSSVTSLELKIYSSTYDFSFLEQMSQLRWVDLEIYHHMLTNAAEGLSKCHGLRGLKLRLEKDGRAESTVDPNLDLCKFLGPLSELQKLDLGGGILLRTSGQVRAPNLVQQKLIDVRLGNALHMIAPKLATLTASAEVLENMHILQNSRLKELYIHAHKFEQPFEPAVCPSVRRNIQKLEIVGFTVVIDSFFQKLSEWKSLKHLSLARCVIFCNKGANISQIAVPNLEKLSVDRSYINDVVVAAGEEQGGGGGVGRNYRFPICVRGTTMVRARDWSCWTAPTPLPQRAG